MELLILLNGNAKKMFEANGLDSSVLEIVKLDEKKFSEPRYMKSIIKKKKYSKIYFGCIELELQRFHPFMKMYILLSKAKKGAIIDEDGNMNDFHFIKLLIIELPLLFLEIIASIFVVMYSYLKFPILKWRLTKKR